MVEFILMGQAIDPHTYRIGLSQVFFRAGTLSQLDRQVEDITHDTMVAFQVCVCVCVCVCGRDGGRGDATWF